MHEQQNKLGHKQRKQQIQSKPPTMIAIKDPIMIGKLWKNGIKFRFLGKESLTFLSTIVVNILMCH